MADASETAPPTGGSRPGKGIFAPRQIARMAILIALSAVGALIKIPSPTGTVAFDSAPGFFAGVAFGGLPSAIVGGIGHLASALTTGFPLSLPVHLLVAIVVMPVSVVAFGYLARRTFLILAAVVAIALNAIAGIVVVMPFIGAGPAIALLVPLLVGATANVVIASAAYSVLARGGLVGERRNGNG
ncbi:ECF transporter S component [Actinopolymorpha alba]|uniref:ECF transporter S component n=1 Tax=Actinopolymorpha alba TaxID=533267 RepID=UPI0003789D26|nr:ECF transporter S component [Actinopolymorpha alba]